VSAELWFAFAAMGWVSFCLGFVACALLGVTKL
jgi:hypothetical protein